MKIDMEGITPIRRYSSAITSEQGDTDNVIQEKDTVQPEPTYVPPADVRKETVEERKRTWYHPLSLFQLALDNWFLIGIFVFIILASQFPAVAKTGGREFPLPALETRREHEMRADSRYTFRVHGAYSAATLPRLSPAVRETRPDLTL
jgi:sodium/bile acid cotransporter 7